MRITGKFTLAALLIWMMSVSMLAQNVSFGKPSKEELALTECTNDPNAPAVVLCKTMSLTYEFSSSFEVYGNTPEITPQNYAHSGVNKYITADGTSMLYNVKMRTKILKPEGKGYANVDIMYYDKKGDIDKRDEFYSFNVVVYRNVNGKNKKIRIDKASWKDERINDEFMVRRLRIADASEGDIVDVMYELFSKRIAYIYDWQFQDDVPVLYSKCEMQIPCFLNYNVNYAIRPNIKADVTDGHILLKQEISDLQAPKKCRTNDYTIVAKDMLPWGIDPIKEKAGAKLAEMRPFIDSSSFKGIPMPTPIPDGRIWITTNPQ